MDVQQGKHLSKMQVGKCARPVQKRLVSRKGVRQVRSPMGDTGACEMNPAQVRAIDLRYILKGLQVRYKTSMSSEVKALIKADMLAKAYELSCILADAKTEQEVNRA